MLDPKSIKEQFPIFHNEPQLTYLDSTATALKPQCVIDKIAEYYVHYPANTLRGVYPLSERATKEFEHVRKSVTQFIHAKESREVIFTKNTTESLNLLAYTLTKDHDADDEVVVTAMEHHSNFVPWQQLTKKNDSKFRVMPFDTEGLLNLDLLEKYITPKTRIFACTHISNVLGTINPLKEIIQKVRSLNPETLVVIDGAQAVSHISIDVQEIDCDFYAFSAHKMFGPTGVGVLWGKAELLEKLPPFLYGGEMVQSVLIDSTEFQDIPHKFEAGTPAIGEVIGLGAAIEFIHSIEYDAIHEYETSLASYAQEKLQESFGNDLGILGPSNLQDRCSLFSFTLKGIHPHDIAQILGENNVCVRAGSHCAMPLHKQLGFDCAASVRASFSIYNTQEDADKLIEGLQGVQKIFTRS